MKPQRLVSAELPAADPSCFPPFWIISKPSEVSQQPQDRCTGQHRHPMRATAFLHAHLIRVLIFWVWMSYKRCTASLICFLLDRTSTMKTCIVKTENGAVRLVGTSESGMLGQACGPHLHVHRYTLCMESCTCKK